MAIRQSGRLYKPTVVKNLIRMIPAAILMGLTLNSLSCGKVSLFSQSSSSNTPTATPTSSVTTSPTATPTASPTLARSARSTPSPAGSLAFVTNFADARISSFTRNPATGALTLAGTIVAGAGNGPKGLVASNNFLYVANNADDNIYEFSFDSTAGKLTPLSPPSVSSGAGSGPDQFAINSTGTYLWVTNSHNGTVSAYSVDTSTGQLTQNGSPLGGLNTPFGLALHPSLPILYVADAATGRIFPLTVAGDGRLTQTLPAVHSPDLNADSPGFVAVDPTGGALFVADMKIGEVSTFAIDATTGALTPAFTFQNSNLNDTPIGLGIATNAAVEFLFTANQGLSSIPGSISAFAAGGTSLTAPPTVAGPFSGPTGLAIDPQAQFVYTANQFDGTVSESAINGACGAAICKGSTIATEKPADSNSRPFGIILAN